MSGDDRAKNHGLDDRALINHASLKAAGKVLVRPLESLHVLSDSADPFLCDMPSRVEWATWFAELWSTLELGSPVHLRRIHYVIISQATPMSRPDGKPYENTLDCWQALGRAGRDARYLGLLPANVTIIDRRNPEPAIFHSDEIETRANIDVTRGGLLTHAAQIVPSPELYVPSLVLRRPMIPQPYHVEIWCEKSTQNDILLPFGERFGVNVITGVGQMSVTACERLIDRAEESGRPVRLLYVSDFDPAGEDMPVAVARKIEFLIREKEHLEIQVRPIVLTHEQCVEYQLPRTPLKESVAQRRASFAARYGEGATELDALEALYPGRLEEFLEAEICRYYDTTLQDRVYDVATEVRGVLGEIQRDVYQRHAEAIAEVRTGHQRLVAEIERILERIAELQSEFEESARPKLDAIEADLEAESPSADDFDWPEPQEADEDPDPLFDSSRGYLEQLARYRRHRGKTNDGFKAHALTCTQCGQPFSSRQPWSLFCSDACRQKTYRQQRKAK